MSTTHFQNNVTIDGSVMLAKTGGTTAIGLTDPVVMTQLGQIIVANDNTTSSTTTGSIKTAGGIGVAGNVYVGGTSNVNGTTTMGIAASTPVLVGAFGVTIINNVTESDNTSEGCLQVKGGVGILKNVNIGGSITAGDITQESTGSLTTWIKADTGNTGGEGRNPHLIFSQDGQLTWATIGFDDVTTSGQTQNNNLIIRAGSSTGSVGDIAFYVNGQSDGAITGIAETNTTVTDQGTNIMNLTSAEATINGNLAVTGLLSHNAKFSLGAGTVATFGQTLVLVGASGRIWTNTIDNSSDISILTGGDVGKLQVGTAGTYLISYTVQIKQTVAVQRFVDCHFYVEGVEVEPLTDHIGFTGGEWASFSTTFIYTFAAADKCSIRIKQATSDTSRIERGRIGFVKI
jgi:hypothetical protein